VDNAARYAASKVSLSVVTEGKNAVIEVADDGPGIPVEDRERVFERFVRLDDSRSRQRGGTGLGLAIVRQLVQAHDGTVAFVDASRVRVVLPAQ
jgi:signal transduction histidine kinase